MKHIYNYNDFILENNNSNNISIAAVALNFLTLGQGSKLTKLLSNTFSIKGFLIKSRMTKIEKILLNTIAEYENKLAASSEEVNNNIDAIKLKSQQLVAHIPFKNIKDQLYELLVEYEIKYRVYGFDKTIEKMLTKIKDDITKIGSDENEAKLILNDLNILINKLNDNLNTVMKKERTDLLPVYDIKSIVMNVSKIINGSKDEKTKQLLTHTWQKSKNKLYQQYSELFDIHVLENLLDINNYNVNTKDKKIEDIITAIPSEVKKLSKYVFDVTNVRPQDDFNLSDSKEYYIFNYNNYSLVMYYFGKNNDNINIFVAVGTYKYESKSGKFEHVNIVSKKYSKINNYPHIFYYVPNFKGYIIEGVKKLSSNIYSFATHNQSSLASKIDNYANVDSSSSSSLSAFEQYIQLNINKIVWFKEYTSVGKLTDEFKNEIISDTTNIDSLNVIKNANFSRRWNFIKTNMLDKIGWKSSMTFDDCKKSIFKITT